MKKLTWKVLGFVFLFTFAFSCQQETSDTTAANKVSDNELAPTATNAKYGSRVICLFEIVPGRRFILPWNCFSTGICAIRRRHCIPIIIDWPKFPCRPCPDPWDIAKLIDPEIFIIPEDFGQIGIDRYKNIAIYPINESTVVLQHYAPIKGLIDEKSFELKSTLALDESVIKEFGLEGKVIAPGKKFPVVFNAKNKTYNAIVSVANYPLKHSAPIAQIESPNFKESLNDLFGKYSLKKQPEGVLEETDEQKFAVEPFYSKGEKGIYLFSPDKESLGIVFYGDPHPQPNLTIKGSISLSQEIADALGIKAFELKTENLQQAVDPSTGALTVLITP